ncbi:MAG TPA: glycoside hydrolase family 16 protein [Acholeplasma sp.]|jgi:beta-glucanase (GH16 family)
MKLIFEEHFNIDGSPNPEIWNIEVAGHGFGNNESQFYTDRPKNVFVKQSVLHIVAHKEDYEHRNYTSAKLTTAGKKSFLYGRYEISMKLPKGKGTWPAFWFLGDNVKQGTRWPLCGEIDLMEHVGKDPNRIHFSLHSQNYNHKLGNNPHLHFYKEGLDDDFHKYTMDWTKEGFKFYVDDVLAATIDRNHKNAVEDWPFDAPHFMIINLAIGGFWGGDIDDSIFPVEFLIDYIKVYTWE